VSVTRILATLVELWSVLHNFVTLLLYKSQIKHKIALKVFDLHSSCVSVHEE